MEREQLEKIVHEVFNKPEPIKERNIRFSGCITYGYLDIEKFFHCGNMDCPTCNKFQEAFKKLVNE